MPSAAAATVTVTVTIAAVDPGFIASVPGCDVADAFTIVVPRAGLDARPIAAGAFDHPPAWADAFMKLRNAIGRTRLQGA